MAWEGRIQERRESRDDAWKDGMLLTDRWKNDSLKEGWPEGWRNGEREIEGDR